MTWLIQPIVEDCGNEERQREYDYVFELNELFYGPITSNRSFQSLFDECINGFVNVIANSDIIIPETSVVLMAAIPEGHAYALTRWESETQFYGKKDSQDVWVVRNRPPQDWIDQLDFNMGEPGCDNRLAYELSKIYKVANPSLTIKTIHHHKSGYRTYGKGRGHLKSIVVPPPYLLLPPTEL